MQWGRRPSFLFIMKYSIVWIWYVEFIHSLVDGHVGCLLFLAIITNVAMNICVQVFVWVYIFISSKYIPRNGIAGHIVTLCLTFWGTAKLFSKAAVPFYIYTSGVWGFQGLHILTTLVIICLEGVKWYFIVVLIYISLMDNVFDIFSCMYWLFVYLL